MMESETHPPDTPPREVGDLEVSSRRVSPDPLRPEDNPLAIRDPQYPAPKESDSKGLYSMRSNALKDLLGQAAVSEAHRTLMGTMVERISSVESGLHEAFMSLLRGFEVRKVICIFLTVPHTLGVPYADSSP